MKYFIKSDDFRVISESDEPSNMDEVFEAFIDCDTQYKLQVSFLFI